MTREPRSVTDRLMSMRTNRRYLVLAAASTLTAVGCAAPDAPTAGPTVETSTSASATDRSMPSTGGGTSGRLATVSIADWTDFPDAGQLDVTFHLDARCTTLKDPPSKAVLLVWPHGFAWIDPQRPDTVRLKAPVTGKVAEITDGQRVNLGGTPLTGSRKYVTPPHKSCPADSVFLVTQIN